MRLLGRRAGAVLSIAGCLVGCLVGAGALVPAQAAGPISLPAATFDSHEGNTIHAADGYYYHFGNDYGCASSGTWCGVSVIRATSLSGPWTATGPAFDPSTGPWPQWCDPDVGSYGCYDPVVTYDPATGDYVMWIDINGHHAPSNTYEPSGYAVLTSSEPGSGYQLQAFHREMNEPSNDVHELTYGDESPVWVAGGNLYVAYTVITPPSNYHTIWLTELDSSGVSPVGNAIQISNTDDEGPGLFDANGYWLDTMSWPAGGTSGGGCAFCDSAYTEYSATSVPDASPVTSDAGWTWPTSEPKGAIGSPGCDGQPDHVDFIDGVYYQEINLWNPPPAGSNTAQSQARQMGAGLELYPLSISGNVIAPIGC